MSKISELELLQELNAQTFVPVVDLAEANVEDQNKRASSDVFKGPEGPEGPEGPTGKSAFDVWLEQAGNAGKDEGEFLVSLKGETGNNGADGQNALPLRILGSLENVGQLPDPSERDPGDAYVIEQHWYVHSDDQWKDLGSVAGPEGKSAFDVWLSLGNDGDEEDYMDAIRGEDGIGLTIRGTFSSTDFLPIDAENGDAYIINSYMWVWATDVWAPVGQVGPSGKSAYQEWLDLGNTGSKAQFISSLKGEQGSIGPDGPEGPEGPMGPGITIAGTVADEQSLPTPGVTGTGYMIEDNFWVWDGDAYIDAGKIRGPRGPLGETGPAGTPGETGAALYIAGSVSSVGNLPPTGEPGQAYNVLGNIYSWDGSAWVNGGSFKGDEGPMGPRGPMGPALNLRGAVNSVGELPSGDNTDGDTFYVGTNQYSWYNEQWNDLGDFGGIDGIDGADGADGVDGKSAYEIWLDDNNTGSVEDFLLAIKGEQGSIGPDGPEGPEGPMGPGITIVGAVVDEQSLPPSGASLGEAYMVGTHIYFWNGSVWVDGGEVRGPEGQEGPVGPEGPEGPEGPIGKSAFETWLEQAGNAGKSETDFLLDITGPQGNDGNDGNDGAQGPDGPQGPSGQSAYQLWKSRPGNGTKTEEEFLESNNGKSAYEVWEELSGNTGKSAEQFIQEITGNGLAPKGYTAAVENLPSESNANGDFYTVGENATLYVWYESTWVNCGNLKGSKGDKGEQGDTGGQGIPGNDGTDGNDGLTAFEVYQSQSGNESATFEDFMMSIKGDTGEQGDQGEVGPQGAGVQIIGVVATPEELDTNYTGNAGEGYIVGSGVDPDVYFWDGSEWFNGGKIKGPRGNPGGKGDTGSRGDPGPRGKTGEKGDTGSLWIVFSRAPGALDGRIGDYFFNSASQEIFQKVNSTTWAPLGILGGGNVYDVDTNGKTYVRRDGEWVEFRNMDRYDLATGINSSGVLDLDEQQSFVIDISNAVSLSVTNAPSNRAMTVVTVFKNVSSSSPVGTVTWWSGISWADDEAPVLGDDKTIVVLFWDGTEWFGGLGPKK